MIVFMGDEVDGTRCFACGDFHLLIINESLWGMIDGMEIFSEGLTANSLSCLFFKAVRR